MKNAQTDSSDYAATLYLWPQRTLYIGFIGHLSAMSNGAHTLLLGLDRELSVKVGEETVDARSFLIPAGVTYTAESHGQRIACCFLDPLGRDFCYHRQHMQPHGSGLFLNTEHEGEQLDVLAALFDSRAEAGQALEAITGLLFPSPDEDVNGYKPDDRVRRVVDSIRQDPVSNISNDSLAEAVGLSGDRLQRLFKDATGVPIRRYRLWARLFVISTLMAMGSSLTDAALSAGFSDSSHLTNVFRNMLGMSPSAVLRRSKQVRILVGQEP